MLSRCSRAKQQQKNVQKSLLHVQILFFANSHIIFFYRSRCRRRLALHRLYSA